MKKNERFLVTHIYICPFIKKGENLSLDLSYPERLCVIDLDQGIAIDVENELMYEYIETISMLYFINGSIDKIKLGKRQAVVPFHPININEEKMEKANNIINRIKNGEEFKDGNDVLDNKQYLEYINAEQKKLTKAKTKIKKITKKGK